ncbi:MAG: recombinase family protein [Pirellulales bacterium]|nr:recombinase family protein [Pirellulales bacterium]
MKRYVALARVSSREQEREGFSLDVQEEALARFAERQNGEIVKLYRMAETASKREQRKAFAELLAYAKEHASDLDGVLFYKVDRAARNLFDYVELERLEVDHGVPVIYVAQPTENTPAGRMQRRILANMATFYTEQQSVDVREGLARRVKDGLFMGKAPFGYRNVRCDGRSLVEVDPENAAKVRRIFELYAYQNHTLDAVIETFASEGIQYLPTQPNFVRSKVHTILRDRAYIGKISYRGRWHDGRHEPLVDCETFDRVQVLLGEKNYNSHGSVYGSGMIRCGHCSKPIVAEVKTKKTKAGPREYVYYRCAAYNKGEHPRVRLSEAKLDEQVLSLFRNMKIEDDEVRRWIVDALRASRASSLKTRKDDHENIEREIDQLRAQRERLLTLRLMDEIEQDTFQAKNAELKDRESKLTLKIEAQGRQQCDSADLAVKVFELSQALEDKWLTADIPEKRQLLDIVCLNFLLDDVTLIPTTRKPFDVLAEGRFVLSSRGDRRHERPSGTLGSCLFQRAISFSYEFTVEEFFALGSKE